MTNFGELPEVRRSSETISDAEVYRVEMKAQRLRELYGRAIKFAMLPLLIIFLVVCITFGAPRLFGGSELVAAATVLGVSIIFGGVLVPCVFLIFSRYKVAAELLEDVTDIRGHIKRGRAYGLAIREYRPSSKAHE